MSVNLLIPNVLRKNAPTLFEYVKFLHNSLHKQLQKLGFDRAKATGLCDPKMGQYCLNIEPFMIAQPRELSRRSKPNF